MALTAIIFDVDGTLIDTNREHVQAWDITLKKHHYVVSTDRIAVEIGKGGDKLVPSVLGEQIEKKDGESLRKGHTAEFKKIAGSTHVKMFDGVKRVVDEIRSRGLKLALATSSKTEELKTTEQSAGVELSKWFDVVATSEDAQESKPAPHILEAAIRKLGIAPTQCAMVGDTPYDADTARDAGAICLGVTCGRMNDEPTLRAAGMRAVYRDPEDIAKHLDEVLRIASPGSMVLDQHRVDQLMKEALAVAREALDAGEAPIGCVIARGDGTIIARAHNELNASQVKTAHAEMAAFARTAGKVPTDAKDLIMVSTLEPCVMCLGAAMEASVDTILFGLPAPMDGGRTRVRPPVSPETQMPRILGDVLADESRKLFQQFLDRRPANPQQVAFVRQLLAHV